MFHSTPYTDICLTPCLRWRCPISLLELHTRLTSILNLFCITNDYWWLVSYEKCLKQSLCMNYATPSPHHEPKPFYSIRWCVGVSANCLADTATIEFDHLSSRCWSIENWECLRDVSDVAMSDDCMHRCWKSKAYPEHCIFVAPLRTVGSSSSLSRVQWYNSPRLTSSLVNTNDLTHSKTWFWIFCLKAVVVLPINSKWSHLKRLVKLIKLYLSSSYQSEYSCLAPSLSRLPTLPSLPCIFSLSTSPAQPPCISWLPNLQQTPC